MFQALAIEQLIAPMLMDHTNSKGDVAELQRQCKRESDRERGREKNALLSLNYSNTFVYAYVPGARPYIIILYITLCLCSIRMAILTLWNYIHVWNYLDH